MKRMRNGKAYLPYLDGIRGFGFLLVFLVHYFSPSLFSHMGHQAVRVMTAFEVFDRLAVPMFFVLSGYLIGGILYGTRNREGYFRIFYYRRMARIVPLYFLVLITAGVIELSIKYPFDWYYWSHYLFIQNLFWGYGQRSNPVVLAHFWSLATEEQFYLLWPLFVWLVPKRRSLFAVAAGLMALTFLVRFEAHRFLPSPNDMHYFTPTRADAILLGVMISLLQGKTILIMLQRIAKYWLPVSVAAMFSWAYWKEQSWPETFRGEQLGIPLLNFTCAAVILLVLREGSWLNRACCMPWICWFGRRSYSLYIFHFTYYHWFMDVVIPFLARFLPYTLAGLVSNTIAFLLTLGLGVLSYRFIEQPMQEFKERRLKYGPVRDKTPTKQLAPAEMGA